MSFIYKIEMLLSIPKQNTKEIENNEKKEYTSKKFTNDSKNFKSSNKREFKQDFKSPQRNFEPQEPQKNHKIKMEKQFQNTEKSDKKPYKPQNCFVVYCKSAQTFDAMYGEKKVSFRLLGIDSEDKKIKSLLYEKIAKKVLYLNFHGQDDEGNTIVEAFQDKEKTKSINKILMDEISKNSSVKIEAKEEAIVQNPISTNNTDESTDTEYTLDDYESEEGVSTAPFSFPNRSAVTKTTPSPEESGQVKRVLSFNPKK